MGTDRRAFIRQCGLAGAGLLLTRHSWAIPPAKTTDGRSLTFGIISDLHHLQFHNSEVLRMKSFKDYGNSNWPRESTRRSFSYEEQLEWLRRDLADAVHPVIVFMHQPVFISDFFTEIGNADEILKIFDEANFAATTAGKPSRVAAVFMGHDHDDRYGERNGVHYFLINSATYSYCESGAHYYTDSLFAFVTLDPAGRLILEGRISTYREPTPDDVKSVFPARISDHRIEI